jgi:IMP cyclohydrolase
VTSYFVYYRVEAGRVASLRDEVHRMFRTIEAATGVRGRWMRRRDEAATYMEVYEAVGDEAAFESLLASEGAKLGLERHIERFVACA